MTNLPEVTRPGRDQDRSPVFKKSQPQPKAAAEPADGAVPPVAGAEGATSDVQHRVKLPDETGRSERARSILRSAAGLRPLGTSAAGVPLKVASPDKANS